MESKRILVADPHAPVRKLLGLIFDVSSYALDFASDGEEALGRALVEPPELLIAELRLDRLDGALLCERLKQHPRTSATRVLILTTCTSDLDAKRARRAGADAYITKPFRPAVLMRQVDELLRTTPAVSMPARPLRCSQP